MHAVLAGNVPVSCRLQEKALSAQLLTEKVAIVLVADLKKHISASHGADCLNC